MDYRRLTSKFSGGDGEENRKTVSRKSENRISGSRHYMEEEKSNPGSKINQSSRDAQGVISTDINESNDKFQYGYSSEYSHDPS